MQNAAKYLANELLEIQYLRVKKQTNTSHVEQYGSLGIAIEPIRNYERRLTRNCLELN